jgi:hypothetical protein
MKLQPINWSVVLVGGWNPHILTPAGVAKRVYKEEKGATLRVEVPLDGESPHRVFNPKEEISVVCTDQKLTIDLTQAKYENLALALESGVNVLASLPETPVEAVGYNLNFGRNQFDNDFYKLIEAGFDTTFSDAGFSLVERGIKRGVSYKTGRINITATITETKCSLMLNFHLSSKDKAKLKEWMTTDINTIKDDVNKILRIFSCEQEELSNEPDEQ